MVVSFVKSNENTYPEGRALMVPITKKGNFSQSPVTIPVSLS